MNLHAAAVELIGDEVRAGRLEWPRMARTSDSAVPTPFLRRTLRATALRLIGVRFPRSKWPDELVGLVAAVAMVAASRLRKAQNVQKSAHLLGNKVYNRLLS